METAATIAMRPTMAVRLAELGRPAATAQRGVPPTARWGTRSDRSRRSATGRSPPRRYSRPRATGPAATGCASSWRQGRQSRTRPAAGRPRATRGGHGHDRPDRPAPAGMRGVRDATMAEWRVPWAAGLAAGRAKTAERSKEGS